MGQDEPRSPDARNPLEARTPARATKIESLRVLIATAGTPAARGVVAAPALAALVVLLVALARAPEIEQSDHGRFSTMFGTTAQVIATLVVALAFEARALRREDRNLRRLVATVTLSYVAVGGTAAVVALNPGLSECAYRVLFALSVAGAAGALLSVLAIAYRAISADDDQGPE